MKEIKKYRDAKITVVPNGFIVEIGCQKVVAESPKRLLELIKGYLEDPKKAEKRIMGESICRGEAPLGNLIFSNTGNTVTYANTPSFLTAANT